MSRAISVYQGQDHIGTVIERGDKTFIAKDLVGHKLGPFPNVQKAADAITELHRVFEAKPAVRPA